MSRLLLCLVSVLAVSAATAGNLRPIERLPVVGTDALINPLTNILYTASCLEGDCGVTAYDLDTDEATPVAVGGADFFLNLASNTIFASNGESVYAIDGDTQEVTTFPFYSNDARFAINYPENRLYIAGNSRAGGVDRIRIYAYEADTHELVTTAEYLPINERTALAVDASNNTLFVTLGPTAVLPARVAVLDGTTLAEVASIDGITISLWFNHLVYNPRADRLYAFGTDVDGVTALDTRANVVINTVNIPAPQGVAVVARQGYAYVTSDESSEVSVVNDDGELETIIEIGDGEALGPITANQLTGSVYVAHSGPKYEGIAVISSARLRLSQRLNLGIRITEFLLPRGWNQRIYAIGRTDVSYVLVENSGNSLDYYQEASFRGTCADVEWKEPTCGNSGSVTTASSIPLMTITTWSTLPQSAIEAMHTGEARLALPLRLASCQCACTTASWMDT
jgi:DNA-binding beta-propeller fold protein YncE